MNPGNLLTFFLLSSKNYFRQISSKNATIGVTLMQRDYRSVLTNFKSDDATTHTESSNFCLFSCSCQDMTKLALLLLTTIRSLALIGGVWNSTLMIKPHSKFLKTLIPIPVFKPHFCIIHVKRNSVIIFFELTMKIFEKFKFDTINAFAFLIITSLW